MNITNINRNFSVKTEDGDYLALNGEPEKQEEKLKMEETGTDYSDDYEDEEEAWVLMFPF